MFFGNSRGSGKARWVLACALGWLWLAGCLQKTDLSRKYQELTIESLSPDVGFLQLKMAPCLNERKRENNVRVQSRKVHLAVGGEHFYVPRLPAGVVALQVLAFRSSENDPILQFARINIEVREGQQKLPTIELITGTPPSHIRDLYWCSPVPPLKQPDAKDSAPTPAPLPPTSGTSLPPLPPAIPGLPVPPPATPDPGPAQDIDQLEWRKALRRSTPSSAISASGRMVAVVNAPSASLEQSISILDVISGQRSIEIRLPTGCNAQGIDLQGNVCAVVCTRLNRTFFFDAETGKGIGPALGVPVGRKPVAVRISGKYAAVANYESQDVTVIHIDRWSEAPKAFSVGEGPLAISAVNGHFFVANSASRSVSSFHVDASFGIHADTDYQVGKRPTGIAVNGRYLVTANSEGANITVWDLLQSSSRTVALQGKPHSVVLLSHTAVITDLAHERLHVVDLRSGKATQALPMHTSIEKIALSGEWLIMSSPTATSLPRASFSTRPHLQQLRVGTYPSHLHVAQGKAWTYDRLGKQMLVVDLRRQRVERRIPLQIDGWFSGTDDLLLHTDVNREKLVIRPLASMNKVLETRKYRTPIQFGRVVLQKKEGKIVRRMAYLLHWNPNGDEPAYLSQIELLKADSGLQWDFSRHSPLLFAGARLEPTDVMPWGEQILITDRRTQALYLLDATTEQLKVVRSLELPSRPKHMALAGKQVALTLDNGELWLVDMPSLTKAHALQLASTRGELSQMKAHNGLLAISHLAEGSVYIVDPKGRTINARIRVGCSPKGIHFWHNPADVGPWRHALLVSNYCSESLSLSPLRVGSDD